MDAIEVLKEYKRRGIEPPEQYRAIYDEALRRGLLEEQAAAPTAAGGTPTPKGSPPPEQEASLGENIVGAIDLGINTVTSGVASVLGNLAEVGAATPFAMEIRRLARKAGFDQASEENAAQVGNQVDKMFTADLKTKKGKEFQQAIGKYVTEAISGTMIEDGIEGIVNGIDSYRNFVTDQTGSEVIGNAAVAAPELVLDFMGGYLATPARGAKRLSKGARLADIDIRNQVLDSEVKLADVRALRDGVYKEISDSGVKLKPNVADSAINYIEKKLLDEGVDIDGLGFGARLNGMRRTFGGELPNKVEDLDAIKRRLYRNLKSGDEEKLFAANAANAALDEFIAGLGDRSFIGNMTGDQLRKQLGTARELGGRVIRSRQINKIFRDASLYRGSEMQKMTEGLRNLLKNDNVNKFYSPDEIKLMRDIVTDNIPSDVGFIRMFGRMGVDVATLPVATVRLLRAFGNSKFRQMRLVSPAEYAQNRLLGKQQSFDKAFKQLQKQVLSGKDSSKVIERYLKAVPKSKRDPNVLGELMVRSGTNLDELDIKANKLQKEALEYARGVKSLGGALSTLGIPSPTFGEEEDDQIR